MITIKLPIQNKINILDYQKEFNSCVRFAYNCLRKDKLNEKDIRHLIKTKSLFNNNLDTWMIQCAIREAKSWLEKSKDFDKPIIFGGRKNLKLRRENKISNDEWKLLRLHPLYIEGEALQKGNRKFELDVIENNKIIFKPNRNTKIDIILPKLKKNVKNQLVTLEELSKSYKIPFTVRLTNDYIFINFDEKILSENKVSLNKSRVFGIDLNPNYIGWAVLEFDLNNNFIIIDSGVIDNSKLNIKLKVPSNHPKQIYQNNKREYEIFQVSKYLINKCLFYHCQKFVVEELNIKSKDHQKGNKFNRLVNNCWNRNDLINNLNKRCNIYNIDFIQVNPKYSSFVGNLLYGSNYPDMMPSSIEIARRGYRKWQKNWFYPNLITKENLSTRWKEAKDWMFKDWKELYFVITKTLKLSYRSSLNNFKFRVFRLNNIKSMVDLYSF